MTSLVVGRLERVALREVWRHEAYEFTTWLEGNIDVLNDALGLGLVNVYREQAAGAFSIDLVGEDEAGAKVIIENQLEKSNHDHLGKVITYMVAMEAHAAVWIVADPRPEHVAAVAWLNESSSANVYLVKVEAVRIGDSPVAPLLTLIVGPSDESEAIARSKREFSERHDLRQRWWTGLLANPGVVLHRHISPSPRSYIAVSSGVRGLQLNYGIRRDEWFVELYIDRGPGEEEETKAVFDQLHAHKSEVETSFGAELEWDRLDDRRAAFVRFTGPGGYRSPDEEWASIQKRQVEAMNQLNGALKPCLGSLTLGA